MNADPVGLRRSLNLIVSGTLLLSACVASPQSYPVKPVRILVGNPPGAGIDITARTVGQRLSEILGVPFITDNRPGAAGLIAAEATARAPADGYTLLLVNSSVTTLAYMHPESGLDINRSFTAISLLTESANILTASPNLPARSVKSLIERAKAKPQSTTIGTVPPGGFSHLCTVLFEQISGVQLVSVQYSGIPASVRDLLAGQIDLTFSSIPGVLPHITSGRLRALAVTTIDRTSILPEVPTLNESGLEGYDASLWFGVVGPAKLPAGVLAVLQANIKKALEARDVRSSLMAHSFEPKTSSSAEFAERMRTEGVKWTRLLQATKSSASRNLLR